MKNIRQIYFLCINYKTCSIFFELINDNYYFDGINGNYFFEG